MADSGASSSGAGCLDKLKSYVRTQKGFILSAEIVSSLTPQLELSLFSLSGPRWLCDK